MVTAKTLRKRARQERSEAAAIREIAAAVDALTDKGNLLSPRKPSSLEARELEDKARSQAPPSRPSRSAPSSSGGNPTL